MADRPSTQRSAMRRAIGSPPAAASSSGSGTIVAASASAARSELVPLGSTLWETSPAWKSWPEPIQSGTIQRAGTDTASRSHRPSGELPPAPQQRGVQKHQREGLWPKQRDAGGQQQRLTRPSRSVAVDGEQQERHPQGLRVSVQPGANPVAAEKQPARRSDARGPAGEPPAESVRGDQSEQACGPREQQPEIGCGAAEQRERRGDEDGQGLPRGRAADGRGELEVRNLPTPHDPAPRI